MVSSFLCTLHNIYLLKIMGNLIMQRNDLYTITLIVLTINRQMSFYGNKISQIFKLDIWLVQKMVQNVLPAIAAKRRRHY